MVRTIVHKSQKNHKTIRNYVKELKEESNNSDIEIKQLKTEQLKSKK
jgi:hypothetical protein